MVHQFADECLLPVMVYIARFGGPGPPRQTLKHCLRIHLTSPLRNCCYCKRHPFLIDVSKNNWQNSNWHRRFHISSSLSVRSGTASQFNHASCSAVSLLKICLLHLASQTSFISGPNLLRSNIISAKCNFTEKMQWLVSSWTTETIPAAFLPNHSVIPCMKHPFYL